MKLHKMAGMVLALGLTAALALPSGLTARGASGSSVIEKVTVTFKTTFGEAEEIPDPVVTVSGTGCSLGDVQFMTTYDNWKPGKKVRAEVTVNADSGMVFPVSLNRTQCKVTGADFVSAKALDDNRLQVKVDYRPATVLGNTVKAGWSSGNKKKAVWKAVDYAPGYTLNLYGDNKSVKKLQVETNTVDLSPYMTDTDKIYYYEVKAVPLTSDQKKYLKEGEFVTSTDQEFDWNEVQTGGPDHTGPGDGGSVKGNSYVLPDGSKETNTWKKLSNHWYYFDGNGNMARGWLNMDGRWYYMDQNGVMQTGWVDVNNGSWFYMDANGAMQTGWIQPTPGNWYYLNQAGYMERSWVNIGGKWYYFGADGRMQTGWINPNGVWYYLYGDGSMAVNVHLDGWSIGPDGAAVQTGA